jgi:hypothetical protein
MPQATQLPPWNLLHKHCTHCCECTVESEGLGTRPMHQQQPGTQRQQLTSRPGVCDMIQADHSSRRYNNRWEQAPTLLPKRQPHTLVFV